MGIEGLHRVLIESCDKNDLREVRGRNRLKYAEAIKLRHLHVEKDKVRLEFADLVRCVLTIAAFAEDLERRVRLK